MLKSGPRVFRQLLVLVLALSTFLSSPVQAGVLFSRTAQCESVHQKTSKQFVFDLNFENQNFLNLADYSEGAYESYREINKRQIKKLEAILNALNPKMKYTEKERFDWAREVIERTGQLVGEDDQLRQRAQIEFLRKGLDQFLIDNSERGNLRAELVYKYTRFAEIAFDNFIVRWAAVPVLFPQIRYKELSPGLLKKVLFEGYDRNEAEVMKALKETNRISAFNRFAMVYRKVLLVSALVLAPLAGIFATNRVIDGASAVIVSQTQEAEVQSQALRNMDWAPVENSLLFIHAKENLETQLKRPLTVQESADLKSYMEQKNHHAMGR